MGNEAQSAVDEQLLVHAFARLSAGAMGFSLGLVMGLGLFAATAFLLVRAALSGGPPAPVGPHLALIAGLLPGFAPTWTGALAGLAWGAAIGFAFGVAMASLLNLNHLLYLHVLERRLRRRAIFDGL